MNSETSKIIVGKILGVYGVKGWLKIISHTEPRKNILTYSVWWLKKLGSWEKIVVEDGKIIKGKSVIVKLQNVDDRNLAQSWIGEDIWICKSEMPTLYNSFYWMDLIGCKVYDLNDQLLGTVDSLVDTGSYDVLRVIDEQEKTYLIPFVREHFVFNVDITNKKIQVDWQTNWDTTEI